MMTSINILFPVLNEELRLAEGINQTMAFMRAHPKMANEINIIATQILPDKRVPINAIVAIHAYVPTEAVRFPPSGMYK